jgi:pimeloyl-ACP methyl ester carboxylesterase
MHLERVKSAVISAAGTFAFPDPHVPWTNGMQPLTRRMRWSDHDDWNQINIAPDPSGWLKASQIPIAVVVGERDTQPIKEIPGNPGTNHVERARNWVQSMRKLARDNGKSSRVRLVEVKGVGHNSERLTPASQQALF